MQHCGVEPPDGVWRSHPDADAVCAAEYGHRVLKKTVDTTKTIAMTRPMFLTRFVPTNGKGSYRYDRALALR